MLSVKNRKAGRKKNSKPRRANSIAIYILASTCALFFILASVIAFINYRMYRDAFYDYSSELCLSNNAQAAYVINGDLVEHYATTLTVDGEYKSFASKLDRMKSRINAKYFYIVADTGTPGMFTYIYDATYREENPGKLFALGTLEPKENFLGSEDVLSSGIAFSQARYHNDNYGELYYAYAPIFNSRGDVVAFVGTDIDIAPLYQKMYNYIRMIVLAFILSFLIFAAVHYFLIRCALTVPLAHIMKSAENLVAGRLDFKLSPRILNRADEIGRLSNTFNVTMGNMSRLVGDVELILRAARGGYLDKRTSLSDYQGDFRRMLSGFIMTLDVICWHFDALPEAVAFFGADKSMRYGNKSMHRFLSLHNLSFQSGDFLAEILLGGKDRERIDLFFSGESGQSLTRDLNPFPDRNGQEHGYTLTLLRIYVGGGLAGVGDESHEELCVMLILNDVTSLIRARDEAETASHAKSDFLSRMSHEIRTPLNAIIGMTQIASSSDDMEKVQMCLSKVENSSTHLLGIINDILDLSKIEAGKLELDEGEFSLKKDIDFVVSMMASKAKERDIVINLSEMDIRRDAVYADSLRLNQVLINLLSNAVKFSSQGSAVQLSVKEISREGEASVYSFCVRDQGIGINLEEAHLFRPFEQANASISRTHGGTGLGLAISKSIVEMMNGSISVESAPGQGSAFTFTIKACSSEELSLKGQEEDDTQDAVSWDFTGTRILIVDDIEINREIIIELLRDTGVSTDIAENGRMAVEIFENSPDYYYDLIFMDMQMPVLDGCGATMEIRARPRPDARSVKIIAMTANVMKEDVQRALSAGMDGHLGKPVDIGAMLQIIADSVKETGS